MLADTGCSVHEKGEMIMPKKQAYPAGVLLWLAVVTFSLAATAASAGPLMTFGPDNEAVLQIDYKAQVQMIYRDIGSGPDGTDSTTLFNIRRNRLAFMGELNDKIGIYVQTEFAEDQEVSALYVRTDAAPSEFVFLDAIMRFTINDSFRINVGKFKYNLSRENLEACEAATSLDRSLFIRAPFVRTRDQGVAVWGNLLDGLFQYRVDAMNGRMGTTEDAPAPESSFRYSARAHVSLLDPETAYGYKGTYLGEKKVLTVGGAVQTEADVAYADTVAKTGAKDYNAWTADIFFEYPFPSLGTITVSAAYEDIDMDGAYQGSNPDPGTLGTEGEKNGSYVKVAYLLPGTPLQVFGRYEVWNFASLNNVLDQKLTWSALGLNYYINKQNLKLTLEYAQTDYDKEGTFNGILSKDFTTVVTQLQLGF
jgi:hypothetical protein